MAITLNPEMTLGPGPNQMWGFGGTRTHENSSVIETFHQPLSHQRVVQIFSEAVGDVPANGIGRDDVLQHWNDLEPILRADIEHQIGA